MRGRRHESDQFIEVQEEFAAGASQSEWQAEVEKPHLTRGAARRGARSAQPSNVVSLRRMPHRESRVKSFKQLVEYSGEEEGVQKSLKPTEMAPSRIFVTNDVVGMHLDWPLYSQQAESFATAAHIIVSDAALVRSSLICSTVPQEFTEVGTFVVAMSGLEHRHEVTLDGLGSWGTPQGTTKFYNFCSATRKLMMATPENYTYKVQSNRYIHPGTDERGHFIKKIFCGMTNTGEGCAYAVITYSWEGTPHPIAVAMPTPAPSRERPYGSRSWEASGVDISIDEGAMHHGLPLLSRVAVDFDLACKILLAGVEIPQHSEGLAKTLGYSSVAEHRLANKMAASPETVRNFLNALTRRIRPVFIDRMESWTAFAQAKELMSSNLQAHDLAYICRKEAEQHYDVDPVGSDELFPILANIHQFNEGPRTNIWIRISLSKFEATFNFQASGVDISIDEGAMHHGLPLLSRVAVDFDLACKILLAGVEIPQHR
ncbi:hypothetical protein COOONC_03443 [Cooperia oncophora]